MRSPALVLLFGCLLLAAPLRAQQTPLPDQTPEAEQPLLTDPAQPPLVDPAQPPLADPAQPPEAAPGDVVAPSGPSGLLDGGPSFSEADPNAVIVSLARLYNRGRDRAFFGLPPNETWRAPGPSSSR